MKLGVDRGKSQALQQRLASRNDDFLFMAVVPRCSPGLAPIEFQCLWKRFDKALPQLRMDTLLAIQAGNFLNPADPPFAATFYDGRVFHRSAFPVSVGTCACQELIDGQAGSPNKAPQRSLGDFSVIGHRESSHFTCLFQDDMTAPSARYPPAKASEDTHNIFPAQGRQYRH
jgi:hypothetical protein